MIPICVFGLISTLLLHLIEIRSVFISGGEGRLRQAALFFAMGIIMVQRLRPEHGKETSRNYGCALGATITLFAFYHAQAFQFGVHPFLVFLVNEVLFLILMWVGFTITEACSVDVKGGQTASAGSGILYRLPGLGKAKTKEEEEYEETEEDKKWMERLPSRHPGRVILYFSLFAIPAFGFGLFLFDPDEPGVRLRMGALLFIYLFCAFSLLALSSLRQLGAYFEERDVTLPEMIGLTWMSIAFVVIAVVLLVALYLPQPPSHSGFFIRQRLVSTYHGWQSEHGIKDKGVKDGEGEGGRRDSSSGAGRRSSSERVVEGLKKRYKKYDELGDPVIADAGKNFGWEREYRNRLALMAAADDAFHKVFDLILKGIYFILLPLCALAALYSILTSIGQGFSMHAGKRKWAKEPRRGKLRKNAKPEPEKKEVKTEEPAETPDFPTLSYGPSDGDAQVRRCWKAMVDYCANCGSPCPPDRTPFEFVQSQPKPLKGFEDHALFIANLFTRSEYSNLPLSETERTDLQNFWHALKNFTGSRPEV